MCFITLYIPSHLYRKKNVFLLDSLLEKLSIIITKYAFFMIGGDFNVNLKSPKFKSPSQRVFIEWLETHEMSYTNRTGPTNTWNRIVKGKEISSQTDWFVFNFDSELILDCSSISIKNTPPIKAESTTKVSDHDPLIITIKLPSILDTIKLAPKFRLSLFNISEIKDNTKIFKYRDKYGERLNQLFDNHPVLKLLDLNNPTRNAVSQLGAIFSKVANQALNESISKSMNVSKSFENAFNDAQRVQELMDNQTPFNEILEELRQNKINYIANHLKKLKSMNTSQITKYYSKKIRNRNHKQLSLQLQDIDTHVSLLGDIFNKLPRIPKKKNYIRRIKRNVQIIKLLPYSQFSRLVKQLPRNKSSGPDNIPYESDYSVDNQIDVTDNMWKACLDNFKVVYEQLKSEDTEWRWEAAQLKNKWKNALTDYYKTVRGNAGTGET